MRGRNAKGRAAAEAAERKEVNSMKRKMLAAMCIAAGMLAGMTVYAEEAVTEASDEIVMTEVAEEEAAIAAEAVTEAAVDAEEEAAEAVTEAAVEAGEESGRPTALHVCVHDPSIFEDADGTYYVLGSHTASASTKDLIEWTQINSDYGRGKGVPFYGDLNTTLEIPFRWAGYDDGDCRGGYAIWAPDIIYNPYYVWEDGETGAYMIYLCTSSTWRRSCISFIVSKEMMGPYTFGDMLVYSGFTTNGEYDGNSTRDTSWDNDYLNLKDLVELGAANGGFDEISDKWFNQNGSWDHTYAPNAIDPNVFFDASGEKLYMSYGSWSGGMFLLELDKETGKAIYPGVDGTDEVSGNFVDRYFGVHLIGGDHQSGEGPYISYDPETEYYYLYCTYGGLTADGGYNMRLFRSKDVTGPYLDAAGNNAADNKRSGDRYGIKLIGNYEFYDQLGKKAAGHNSQLVASDGSRYLFYHQRFNVKPQIEGHEVRVHQQFMNEDQWPVTAVYEYLGQQPENYTDEDVTGTYEFIDHGNKTDGDMLETKLVSLEADGTITGTVTGTWEKKDSGKGYDYVTIVIDEVTYKGIFFRQYKENKEEEPVMTFTAIGDDNTCIWGSAADGDNSDMILDSVEADLKRVLFDIAKEHGQFPNELNGCTIEYQSADESVITNDGQVLVPTEKVKVELTCTITFGEAVRECVYKIPVKPE